jgi:hypothetical protein
MKSRIIIMKALIFVISLSLIPFTAFPKGGKRPPKRGKENKCTSSRYCTYGKMPLDRQNRMGLRWYINKKSKNRVWNDPGWCGPVAGMMALYGMKNHNPKVRFNSWLDHKTSKNYGVWRSGEDFDTDWKGGGTYAYDTYIGIKNLVNRARRTKSKYYDRKNSDFDNSKTIKDSIQRRKHIEYVSMCNQKVETKRTLLPNLRYDSAVKKRFQKVGYYEVLGDYIGCHALVINGYDGNRLIAYDPWGRVYTVAIENYLFARHSHNRVIADTNPRVTYIKYKKRDWLNFGHFVKHGGKKKEHTILIDRILFGIFQD